MLKFIKKFLSIAKEFYLAIFTFLISTLSLFFPSNRPLFIINIILGVTIFSLMINIYLSEIIPELIKSFAHYIYNQSDFKFSIIFALITLIIWNFSLSIPDKIFDIFTAGLIFIPNIFDKDNKNRLNDIFKILLIYAGVEFLKTFQTNIDFEFNNKVKWLLSDKNLTLNDISAIFFSILRSTLYTKFYFLSLRILADCVKLNDELVKTEEHKEHK